MKKEARLVYLVLSEEMNGTLCSFCKYSEWQGEGCCEGYAECHHPIESLSFLNKNEEELAPGDDCYGFRPSMSISLIADLVGAIISQGFDEWAYRVYSPTSITVYGRSYNNGVEKSGKVRIG